MTATPAPNGNDQTEQSIREERWKHMSKPVEHATGKMRWLKITEANCLQHSDFIGAGLRVLQQEWEIAEWEDGRWVSRKEWRDIPVAEE